MHVFGILKSNFSASLWALFRQSLNWNERQPAIEIRDLVRDADFGCTKYANVIEWKGRTARCRSGNGATRTRRRAMTSTAQGINNRCRELLKLVTNCSREAPRKYLPPPHDSSARNYSFRHRRHICIHTDLICKSKCY